MLCFIGFDRVVSVSIDQHFRLLCLSVFSLIQSNDLSYFFLNAEILSSPMSVSRLFIVCPVHFSGLFIYYNINSPLLTCSPFCYHRPSCIYAFSSPRFIVSCWNFISGAWLLCFVCVWSAVFYTMKVDGYFYWGEKSNIRFVLKSLKWFESNAEGKFNFNLLLTESYHMILGFFCCCCCLFLAFISTNWTWNCWRNLHV